MKLDYLLLDVFTREPLNGNQLAVVMKAEGLLDGQMQRIAAEFNLSETVFITGHSPERNTASLRIFTPEVELPFAGHPTVGAAVALGLEHKASAIRLEEQVGTITCLIDRIDRRTGHVKFMLPHLPEVVGKSPDKATLALALGIEPEDIGCGLHQPGVYSAGVIFYTIPVRNAHVLNSLQLQKHGWDEVFPLGHKSVYVYTETPDEPDNDFAARMFAPGMGLPEDPATGAGAAALVGELARHVGDGQTEYVVRQGFEMGRPSRIEVQIIKDGDTLKHAGMGGHAVVVGQGSLDFGA
ncbi:MAG: PhzF family phenazine biosynthesis protein [Devosia sp.]